MSIKFMLVTRAKTELQSHDNIQDAMRAIGLEPGKVDFGSLHPRVGIVVYEFGLLAPTAGQHYFSIGQSLFAGNAVLFGVDERGETVDMDHVPTVVFYRDAQEVERAIQAGAVRRPQMAVNGEVYWQWRIDQ